MAPLSKDTVAVANPSGESTVSKASIPAKSASGHLRADAVSFEVPVKVHGSRVTEAVRGATPHTDPFEEETATMIVFPQGGVVRMSTSVSVGQMLVLTNLKSRQDAICRVVKVRTFSKLQGYVEVEFTHAQPGYWGVHFPSDGPAPQNKPRGFGSRRLAAGSNATGGSEGKTRSGRFLVSRAAPINPTGTESPGCKLRGKRLAARSCAACAVRSVSEAHEYFRLHRLAGRCAGGRVSNGDKEGVAACSGSQRNRGPTGSSNIGARTGSACAIGTRTGDPRAIGKDQRVGRFSRRAAARAFAIALAG